jgi:hypothetical protein
MRLRSSKVRCTFFNRSSPSSICSRVTSLSRHLTVALLFLEHSGGVDTRDGRRWTQLHNSRHEVTQLLLDHDANIDVQDNLDGALSEIASNKRYRKITQLLSEHASMVIEEWDQNKYDLYVLCPLIRGL